MGCGGSVIRPPDPSEPYFALYFDRPDKIRIVFADDVTVEIIRGACTNAWKKGIQKAKYETDGSYVFKFRGYPWTLMPCSIEAPVASKILALTILSDLYAAGWDCVLASDLSKAKRDLSTWFFQRATSNSRPKLPIICVSLTGTDSVQLIPAECGMHEIFKDAVQRSYKKGIQGERNLGGCYELKLCGFPWISFSHGESIEARKLVLEIIHQFHAHGYRFYVTASLKTSADCLFFIRETTVGTSLEKFCMISLNLRDRLWLINCPVEVIDVTRQVITHRWGGGIQNEWNLGTENGTDHSWEFKMRGFPWWGGGADAVRSRLFLISLFNDLLQRGWCMVTALQITHQIDDKAVFVLRSCQPGNAPHFCISLNEWDKLRLISAGDDIGELTRQVILASWPGGIQRECDYYGSHEFKLPGMPWYPSLCGNDRRLATAMMCRLLANLSKCGWRVVVSADVSSRFIDRNHDFLTDVHSWFVVYTGFTPPQTGSVQNQGDRPASTAP